MMVMQYVIAVFALSWGNWHLLLEATGGRHRQFGCQVRILNHDWLQADLTTLFKLNFFG